jgi:copper ion binding protein
MENVTYTAPGISCEHCQRSIESAVGALPGVQSVTVEVPTKKVSVSFDPARVTRSQIEVTLDEEGYTVQL